MSFIDQFCFFRQSEDTAFLILKEIYSDLGISPDFIPGVEPQAQFQPDSAVNISQSGSSAGSAGFLASTDKGTTK